VPCLSHNTGKCNYYKYAFFYLRSNQDYTLDKEQEQVDCLESEDPLSEYEQQRLKRIEENNKTLLKLVHL
jgi:hypothetical protein